MSEDSSDLPENSEKIAKTAGGDPPNDTDVEAGAAERGPSVEPGSDGADADADQEGDDAAEDEGPVDSASPEAIARRVAALGEEDESEKMARLEEEKLAKRRALAKGKKKGGLETAASKRLSKIGAKATPKRAVATAVDADPLLNQTAKINKWAKENSKTVAIVGGAIAVGLAGFMGWSYFDHKKQADASLELSQAVSDQRGRIGDPEKEEPDNGGAKDPRPVFKTSDERRESALKKYRDVQQRFPGTGAAIISRLGEGSLLLDMHKPDEAMAAFNDVKGSALAEADVEVRGRALEGIGFAHEQKGAADEAIKAFREMENRADVLGFKELGMYHQARVLEAKGDKDKAKEILKTVHERISKPGENHPFPYLKEVVDDRLRTLDPTALPPKPSGAMGGAGGPKMSEEQIKKMIEQLQKGKDKDHGGGDKK